MSEAKEKFEQEKANRLEAIEYRKENGPGRPEDIALVRQLLEYTELIPLDSDTYEAIRIWKNRSSED